MSITDVLSEEELNCFVEKSIEMGCIGNPELKELIEEYKDTSNSINNPTYDKLLIEEGKRNNNSVNYNKIRFDDSVYE